MLDNSSGKPTINLLADLETLCDAWETVEWKHHEMMRKRDEIQKHTFNAGVFATCDKFKVSVDTIPLSSNQNLPFHGVYQDCGDYQGVIAAFAIDPTQDFLVLLENQGNRVSVIHIQTISKRTPHPLARNATLPFSTPYMYHDNSPGSRTTVYIRHEFLAVTFTCGYVKDKTFSLLLWNWHEGFLIYVCHVCFYSISF